MTHLHIDDFKLGLDVRKSILTALPGSLQTLDNCVVTQGGEIEKAKAWVPVYTLPAGTVGLVGTTAGAAVTNFPTLTTFALGGVTSTLAALANGVTVTKQALAAGGGDTSLTYVFDAAEYGTAQFFVTASVNNNATLHNWWAGTQVPQYLGFPTLVFGQKMYRAGGTVLYFSGVGDPSVTNPLNPLGTGPNTVNPGAGFIDLAHLSDQMTWAFDMTVFYKQVAVFGRYVTLLFTLDPDPALNDLQQTIGIGTISYGSAQPFGTGDVLFLSDTGVRSLRALNVSLAAGVADVGSPIDPLIQAAIQAGTGPQLNFSRGLVDPLTGRYWLSLGNTFYILSYWPSAHITAWSTITMPFQIDAFTRAGQWLFCRSGDVVYQYGGLSGTAYDNSPATVVTPFHPADTPTTFKTPISIGAMVSGTWSISVGMQTDNPTLYELAATVTGDTYSMQRLPFAGNGTHIGFKLVCTDAAASKLGALQVQFQKTVET